MTQTIPFCNTHDDQPMRWVPAGTSKATGKPYNGFWVCEVCRPRRTANKGVPGANSGQNDALKERLAALEASVLETKSKVEELLEHFKSEKPVTW